MSLSGIGRMNLKICKLPSDEAALDNKVLLSPQDAKVLKSSCSQLGYFVKIKDFIFTFDENKDIKQGTIGLSTPHRRFVAVQLGEPVDIIPFVPDEQKIYLGKVVLEVDFLVKNKRIEEDFNPEDITKAVTRWFMGQFFSLGQKFVTEVNGVYVELKVKLVEVIDLGSIAKGGDLKDDIVQAQRGILHTNTLIQYEKASGSSIRLNLGEGVSRMDLFRPEFNFENMGIGGLDREFADIFRRAFASRIFPVGIIKKLGIQHVKGILLFGPPGTGKTLMARQIGKMLNGREPKVVNGPEVLNKYVGQSEENIRNLFKEAEQEYRDKGDSSGLHIIIFDEIDAICKQRGSRQDNTGVGDTVVNQLLSKIDGVEALNNILVIGMTNRRDLIDEALLRPGRLEVQLEIGLPDESGRLQILKIHTKHMRDNKMMGDDVSLEQLAIETKNFSGAEIEGLVKSATSFALNRKVDATSGIKVKDTDVLVTKMDFDRALEEVKPAFGVDRDEFENCIRNGIICYGSKVEKLLATGKLFVDQVRNSDRTPLVTVLLEGSSGSGKTALAAKIATESGYPYVKLISPESFVGYTESGKCSRISKIFDDAYKSPLSVIVVDDLERLLDYVRIGPRFSNIVLQTLLVYLKKIPPHGRKLLILSTTGNKQLLEEMELSECFNAVMSVPQISTREEFLRTLQELSMFEDKTTLTKAASVFSNEPISIKRLIMIAEMAKQGDPSSTLEKFSRFFQERSF